MSSLLSLNNNTKRNKGKRPPRSSNACPMFPPPFNAAIQFKHRFRFEVAGTSANTTNFTSTNLIMLLVYANGPNSNQLNSIITAVRLRKIYMWQNGGTVSVEFQSTASANVGNRPTVISDTSYGQTYLAKVCAVPPKTSAAAQWQNVTTGSSVTTGATFILTCSPNATVDVILDVVLQNGDPEFIDTDGYQQNQTTGQLFLNALDNSASQPIYIPVSYLAPAGVAIG